MGGLPKPTAIAEAEGSFKRHPARRRQHEPDSGRGVGPAPAYLPEDQRAIWDEIVGDCAPGVFQSGDRVVLEALSGLVAQMRRDADGFGSRKLAELRALLAHCGMTPAARAKVAVLPTGSEKPKSGLARFRAGS